MSDTGPIELLLDTLIQSGAQPVKVASEPDPDLAGRTRCLISGPTREAVQAEIDRLEPKGNGYANFIGPRRCSLGGYLARGEVVCWENAHV